MSERAHHGCLYKAVRFFTQEIIAREGAAAANLHQLFWGGTQLWQQNGLTSSAGFKQTLVGLLEREAGATQFGRVHFGTSRTRVRWWVKCRLGWRRSKSTIFHTASQTPELSIGH